MRTTLWSTSIGDIAANLAFKNNFAATTNPGAGDDAADGYEAGSIWINGSTDAVYTCTDPTTGAAVWVLQGVTGITPTELAYLDGALPDTVVASKAAIYGTTGLLAILSGAIAAAGTNQATATALSKQMNPVTGADGTVGVALPAAGVSQAVLVINTSASAALPVYPVASGNDQINGIAVNSPATLGPGRAAWFVPTSATQWYVDAASLTAVTPAQAALLVQGVAAGYKIARGIHTQVAQSDTVVTGLATVVAVVAQFQSAPTVKQLFVAGDIGTQAGAPAAGSILLKTYKPTAVNDVTPAPATDFTDNLAISWIAVGT